MSSFLFYPSPPSAQTTSFFSSSFTPQAHRTSPFNLKKTTLFTPQTPSPLRTSRNANLMRTPGDTTKQGKQWQNEWSDENEHLDAPTTIPEPPSSPLAHTIANTTQPLAYSTSDQDNTNQTSIFSTDFSPQFTTTTQQSRASHFQQRARESSPSAQVASHVRGVRDSRKQQFLGRLRNRRSEERDERGLNQLQRIDYLRDMQERQRDFELGGEQYYFQEPDLIEAEMEVELSQLDGGAQDDQQPSPTEERELEDLVSYLQPGNRPTENDDYMFDGDDEDFDEVLALMQPPVMQGFGGDNFSTGPNSTSVDELAVSATPPPNDMEMDTS